MFTLRTLSAKLAVAVLALGVSALASQVRAEVPQVDQVERILPYDDDYYTMDLRAGDIVEVGILGAGRSDLDLYILDPFGHVIASDTNALDVGYVHFVAPRSGRYVVHVSNLGGSANRYELVIR